MYVSPSIASADVMHLADETVFVNQYFSEIHIDIEDGVVVNGISFGMKVAREIRAITNMPMSLHLEVLNPLDYFDDICAVHPDVLFIQTDHLRNPLPIIKQYLNACVHTGIAVGDRDLYRDYSEIYNVTDVVLVSTAFHEDDEQKYQPIMEKYALELAANKKVWIDGGITKQIYKKLKSSKIHAAVMGRGVFLNKDTAVKEFR